MSVTDSQCQRPLATRAPSGANPAFKKLEVAVPWDGIPAGNALYEMIQTTKTTPGVTVLGSRAHRSKALDSLFQINAFLPCALSIYPHLGLFTTRETQPVVIFVPKLVGKRLPKARAFKIQNGQRQGAVPDEA